jgi:nucleosome binding factor SPN SPT16 subunit
LQAKKLEELKKRFARNEIQGTTKKDKVKKMGEIQSYSQVKEVPRDVKPGLLYVDKAHSTILVPYNNLGAFVPFHVSTIKSVSTNTEGQWTFLRINFNYPSGTQIQYPPEATADPNSLFIRELTLKN